MRILTTGCKILCVLSLLLCVCIVSFAKEVGSSQNSQIDPNVRNFDEYSRDNSDWWSFIQQDYMEYIVRKKKHPSYPQVPEQKRWLSDKNFTVLGIKLQNDEDKTFAKAAEKLGRTTLLSRGDAAYGRTQACYVSSIKAQKTYFIIETGELDFNVYIFSDALSWSGSDRCLHSNLITENLGTDSGIHLGQTPQEVIAILGQPSKGSKDELRYSFTMARKRTPKELDDIRKERSRDIPALTEQDLHHYYDYWHQYCGITAKFKNSKLIYLAISREDNE